MRESDELKIPGQEALDTAHQNLPNVSSKLTSVGVESNPRQPSLQDGL